MIDPYRCSVYLGASQEEIKSIQKKAKECHPDLHSEDQKLLVK